MKKEIELLDEFEDERPLTVDVDELPVIVRVEPMEEDISSSNGTILLEDSSLKEEYSSNSSHTSAEEKRVTSQNSKKRNLFFENLKMLIRKTIFIILLFYILFFHIFGVTRIPDRSMSPNIAPGDLLLYYRLDHDYVVGDVVTFVQDEKRYSLRIIATEGQTITISSSGDFLIDGDIEQHQTYLKTILPVKSSISYPYKVPKNKVFVVGDYRADSGDSRTFGAIDTKIIDGKVISLLQTKDI